MAVKIDMSVSANVMCQSYVSAEKQRFTFRSRQGFNDNYVQLDETFMCNIFRASYISY